MAHRTKGEGVEKGGNKNSQLVKNRRTPGARKSKRGRIFPNGMRINEGEKYSGTT